MTPPPTDEEILDTVVLIDPLADSGTNPAPRQISDIARRVRQAGERCFVAAWPEDPGVGLGLCVFDAHRPRPNDAQIVRVYRAMRDFAGGQLLMREVANVRPT